MKNLLLFLIPSLIWGSTWLAIKFQLGVVDPLVSVVYRFFFASIILFIFCRVTNLNLKYNTRQHLYMALQGFLLFGINYWLVYLAELHLPSGLVAVIFSTLIFMNILNGAIILKSSIRPIVIFGAIMGFIGIGLVFKQELFSFGLSSNNSMALILAILGAFLASLGNITSAHNQKNNLPVIQTNAFGMLYGAISMLIITLLVDKPFNFDVSFAYISSLIYLAVFGSVIAFNSYLTLLGRVGADKSGYVALVIPVFALILSTIFEGYRWTIFALFGVFFILMGNVLVLKKK
ncbi:EamA family transporter [candidate division KSB1 bacterium]|nr:EamA family transporter [candidate division KSB1 bacterium]MBL7094587.1 EamA family transporter [candidate division KSB1 bacterium]